MWNRLLGFTESEGTMDTTVAKGMAVLEALARAKRPMRLAALTEQLGLQKSNVHRLLNTFMELGYVQQDPETSRYFASLKTWELGAGIISTNSLRRSVAPHLQAMQEKTRETVMLTVPVDDEVLFLDRAAQVRALRYVPLNGTRAPMVFTAAGRAILSRRPDPRDAVARSIAACPPEAGFVLSQVLEDLEKARRDGYASLVGGFTPWARVVAVALPGPGGAPAAAIAISGPEERMAGDHLTEVLDVLLATAAEIGEVSPA